MEWGRWAGFSASKPADPMKLLEGDQQNPVRQAPLGQGHRLGIPVPITRQWSAVSCPQRPHPGALNTSRPRPLVVELRGQPRTGIGHGKKAPPVIVEYEAGKPTELFCKRA